MRKIFKLIKTNSFMHKSTAKYLLLAGLLIILVLPFCSSQLIFKQNNEADIKIPCFNNNTYCSASAMCNITIIYPNTTALIDNQRMTNFYTYHNLTLSSTQTTTTGDYSVIATCRDGSYNGASTFELTITPTGSVATSSQGIMAIAILIGMLIVTAIFLVLAFKFMDYENLFPIAIFFLLVAILGCIYCLYLGLVYSRDYLYLSAVSSPQEKIFIGILYGLTAIMFIALLMFVIKALKEIKERRSVQKYGAGYNRKTKQYES